MNFTANFKRTGACKGCIVKEGCNYANIALTLEITGDYQQVERALMFAIAAGRGKLPQEYTKKELHEEDD